jgi:hypothetical protein
LDTVGQGVAAPYPGRAAKRQFFTTPNRLLKKNHPWSFSTRKAKSAIFALLHFSSTYSVLEKWRRVRAPHAGCFSTAC